MYSNRVIGVEVCEGGRRRRGLSGSDMRMRRSSMLTEAYVPANLSLTRELHLLICMPTSVRLDTLSSHHSPHSSQSGIEKQVFFGHTK